jgi:hypothetical protein
MRGEHQYGATACFIYPHPGPLPHAGEGMRPRSSLADFHVPAPCDLAVTTWNQMLIPVARHFNGTAMMVNE